MLFKNVLNYIKYWYSKIISKWKYFVCDSKAWAYSLKIRCFTVLRKSIIKRDFKQNCFEKEISVI